MTAPYPAMSNVMLIPGNVRHLLAISGIQQIKVLFVHAHILPPRGEARKTNVHTTTTFQIL
jgi:hypothetical protein